MTTTCLRCDRVGDSAAGTCPECGAPLYRSAPARSVSRERTLSGNGPLDTAEDRALSEARPVTTGARSVFATVGALSVMLVLLSRGAPDPGARRENSLVPPGGPSGILVYASAEGRGSARLWRWNLASGEVDRGPLIPDPVELVNVRSSDLGWLGITSDRGQGVLEASVLDSLEVGAELERLGRGTIVTWARAGEALLVDRGPPSNGCRRTVSVSAAHVERPGQERVMRETLCGDVLSVGRTSLGHFLTRLGPHGVDVVGAGYRDAGLLLPDHGLIAVSPDGDMIVAPSADLPSIDPTSTEVGSRNPAPIRVSGRASLYGQFRGPPVPYLVGGAPLQVDEVLAYGPDSWVALVVGRVGEGRPGLWELPLLASGRSIQPRRVGSDGSFTFAAYADDGTAYVVTGGSLHVLRHHVLKPLEGPKRAPTPAGPLAWIAQEPFADL